MRLVPGGAIGASPSKGRPEACASRWRSVEPGGPAGSSSETIPSSTATSTATAVASFVTEAQAKRRSSVAVCDAPTPSGRDDGDGGVRARPAFDLP